MLFRFFKQISAPNIFSKAVAHYKQGQYQIAKPLLIKSRQWMPTFEENPLFQAILLLCDHHLGSICDMDQLKAVLETLQICPHKDTADYTFVISDIEQILATFPPADSL